jgi:hypothetical protein
MVSFTTPRQKDSDALYEILTYPHDDTAKAEDVADEDQDVHPFGIITVVASVVVP